MTPRSYPLEFECKCIWPEQRRTMRIWHSLEPWYSYAICHNIHPSSRVQSHSNSMVITGYMHNARTSRYPIFCHAAEQCTLVLTLDSFINTKGTCYAVICHILHRYTGEWGSRMNKTLAMRWVLLLLNLVLSVLTSRTGCVPKLRNNHLHLQVDTHMCHSIQIFSWDDQQSKPQMVFIIRLTQDKIFILRVIFRKVEKWVKHFPKDCDRLTLRAVYKSKSILECIYVVCHFNHMHDLHNVAIIEG